MHEDTAQFIRRGYPLPVFEDAVKKLRLHGIEVITHVILGLPGEDHERMLETIRYLNTQDIQGIKLQLLHILKGTDLADIYEHDPFPVFTLEEYVSFIVDCVEIIRPDMVIHRLTGDGPKDLLIAPLWSSAKRHVLNSIHREFRLRDTWQGKYYDSEGEGAVTMADTLTLYKLIVLKMLDEADAPLTGAQITDFILEKEYTNYFTLQQVLSEMSETGLVTRCIHQKQLPLSDHRFRQTYPEIFR